MTLSCIIVDDDSFAIDQIVEYIGQIPHLKLISTFNSAKDALTAISISENPIDILFTDIEMPHLSGISLAKEIRNKVKKLIIISAHLKYAVEGYGVNANGFILKPFNFNKFQTAVNSVYPENEVQLSIKDGKNIQRVNLIDIIAFEGYSNYVKIHTPNRLFVAYYKLTDIENELKDNLNFLRINRSFILSKNHIEKIISKTVYLKNGLKITIGITYKNQFQNLLKELKFQK